MGRKKIPSPSSVSIWQFSCSASTGQQTTTCIYHHKTCISTTCHVSMSHEKSLWRQWVQLHSPRFLCKFGMIKLCRSCMFLMLSLPISLLIQHEVTFITSSQSLLQTLSLLFHCTKHSVGYWIEHTKLTKRNAAIRKIKSV